MGAAWWATMHPEAASPMAPPSSVRGIDIAPWVVHVVGMHDSHAVGLRTRMARREWLRWIATLPPALMGMEAGGRAHDWARGFRP
jgi:hypothetical protein